MNEKTVVLTEPTRTTWRLFCTEPELTPDEREKWRLIRATRRNSPLFAKFLADANIEPLRDDEHTEGWPGIAEWADRYRRWVRCHIEAWQKYTGDRS